MSGLSKKTLGRFHKRRKSVKTTLPRRKLELEALEQRLLLSADLVFSPDLEQQSLSPELQFSNLILPPDSTFFDPQAPVDTALAASFEEVIDVTQDIDVQTLPDPYELQAESIPATINEATEAVNVATTEQTLAPAAAELGSAVQYITDTKSGVQIVIVDSSIPEYESLLEELFQDKTELAQTAGLGYEPSSVITEKLEYSVDQETEEHSSVALIDLQISDLVDQSLSRQVELNEASEIKVFILSAGQDGLDQISYILAQYQDVSAVHILSHGSTAALRLGNSQLNSQNLKQNSSKLKRWGESLTEDGDILLYGCDVANGELGIDFVDNLASYTGADVAASTNLTGAAGSGGDWVLEYNSGVIEADTLFPGGENYAHLLANINGTVDDDVLDSIAGEDDVLTGGASDDTYNFQDDWGSDSVVEAVAGGNDTLNFSTVTTDLQFTIHANGTVSVTDGSNTLTNVANIENLVGGSGNNSFVFENGASITGTINGGENGTNTLDYSAYTTGVTVNLADGNATGMDGIANIINIIGGSASDFLTGDDLNNQLDGGSAGNDTLVGGLGNDTYSLHNNWAQNTLLESLDEGGDSLDFSDVSSNLTFDFDADGLISVTDGVSSKDFTDFEAIVGGAGDDHFTFADQWSDVAISELPGHGSDTLDFSLTNSDLFYTFYDDGTVTVSALEEDGSSLIRVDGIDAIIGSKGDNTFLFEDQVLFNGSISGTVHSTDGIKNTNTLDYSAYTTGITVNLVTGTAHGTSSISNIDNVSGGDGDDTLTGDSGNNLLMGNGGNDLLVGNAGDDHLFGGLGVDRLSYANDDNKVVVNLTTSIATDGFAGTDILSEIEVVEGSAFNDILVGDANANRLIGGAGDDILIGAGGDDSLEGGTGLDTASYQSDISAVTASLATGMATDGTGNTDTFSEIENLQGSDYDDKLTGDANDNVLTGGDGDDILKGLAGADSYRYLDKWGNDTITEISLHTGADALDFSALTTDIEFTLHADNTISVTDRTGVLGDITGSLSFLPKEVGQLLGDGSNVEPVDAIERLMGGSGTNFFALEDGVDQGDLIITVAEGGKALLDYTSYVNAISANITSGLATGIGTITGLTGVIVGAGDAQLTGSDGSDKASFAGGSGGVVVSLAAQSFISATGTGALFGFEELEGTVFDDTLEGDDGLNIIDGNSGDDILIGHAGSDTYKFGNNWGRDTIIELANEGVDTLDFSAVTQDLEFTIHADGTVSVTDGTNSLSHVASIENIIDGSGDDTFIFEDGAVFDGTIGASNLFLDLLGIATGETGSNTLDFSQYTTGLSIDLGFTIPGIAPVPDITLPAFVASAGFGTSILPLFYNIDNVIAGAGDDFIWGNSNDNLIDGGAGDDFISGRDGADTLEGGAGDDIIYGGFELSELAILIATSTPGELALKFGLDLVAFVQHIAAGGSADTFILEKLAGDPNVVSYTTATSGVTVNLATIGSQNTIGAGNDTLFFINNVIGSEFDDTLTGNILPNQMFGMGGDDHLIGGAGSDILEGGEGDDILDGGAQFPGGKDIASYTDAKEGISVDLRISGAQDTRREETGRHEPIPPDSPHP